MNGFQCYQKKIEGNLVKLNSIAASRFYLNNLVTTEGFHIIYHRRGSMSGLDGGGPIDHYEIMSSANKYDDIYISIYNETNTWIPPKGYLFEYDLNIMKDSLPDYDLEEIGEQEIRVDDNYIFKDKSFNFDEEIRHVEKLPPLELAMDNSFGTNMFVRDFPNAVIKENINADLHELNLILSTLKLRMKENI
jgi:hypothetical protein